MNYRINKRNFASVVVAFCSYLLLPQVCHAQSSTGNRTIAAGSGTLSYTDTSTSKTCALPRQPIEGSYTYNDYTSFVFTLGGVSTPVGGGIQAEGITGKDCGSAFGDGTYTLSSSAVIVTVVVKDANIISATPAFPITGFINPKYVVVGVTYAPPGPSSNVTYTNATSIGNTSNISSSFQSGIGYSVSVANKIGVPGGNVASGLASFTTTSSTDYTQQSNSSTTTTINKSTSVAYKTNGTGNAFSPINSDYDTIWIWLNPEMVFSYFPATSGAAAGMQWNGYAYDPNDPSGTGGPDIYPVQVGYLNGDFGSNPSVNAVLARSWATNQTWATGQGPGLTSTDIATIIANDPLTNSSYNLLASLPSTTADGRFTQIPYPPNPVAYTQAGPGNGGGETTTYNLAQTNTQSVASGASTSFKEAFGVEESFNGSFLGLWGTSETMTETYTLTWTNSWLNTLTTSTTLTDALSVTGPGCAQTSAPCVPAYTGPGQFVVYQDNLYGTFMFYPSN